MHLNLFHGSTKFQIVNPAPMYVRLTTGNAITKMQKPGALFTPDPATAHYYGRNSGTFIPPRFTVMELLGYSMPYQYDNCTFKVKFDCKQTVPKLGTFYVYTNIHSLEALDLEPIQ